MYLHMSTLSHFQSLNEKLYLWPPVGRLQSA